jgi:hypothetical protein
MFQKFCLRHVNQDFCNFGDSNPFCFLVQFQEACDGQGFLRPSVNILTGLNLDISSFGIKSHGTEYGGNLFCPVARDSSKLLCLFWSRPWTMIVGTSLILHACILLMHAFCIWDWCVNLGIQDEHVSVWMFELDHGIGNWNWIWTILLFGCFVLDALSNRYWN